MKLFAKGDFTVGDLNSIKPYLVKEKEFCSEYNTYTSGLIKYINLPEGSRIRVTIEILEDDE